MNIKGEIMIHQFRIDFEREFTKIMPPGELTFETDDLCFYNFHWEDVFVKCDFPIIVPIDYNHNSVTIIAQMEAAKIIKEHYL